MSIPPKFHVYYSKIPCLLLQNSRSITTKFQVYYSKIPRRFLQNSTSIPTTFHVYFSKIPCLFLQNSTFIPPKFHVYFSEIPICTLLTVSFLQRRNDKWRHVRKQWSWMCGECKQICDIPNSFQFKLRPNFVYIHEYNKIYLYSRNACCLPVQNLCSVFHLHIKRAKSKIQKTIISLVTYTMKYLTTP